MERPVRNDGANCCPVVDCAEQMLPFVITDRVSPCVQTLYLTALQNGSAAKVFQELVEPLKKGIDMLVVVIQVLIHQVIISLGKFLT